MRSLPVDPVGYWGRSMARSPSDDVIARTSAKADVDSRLEAISIWDKTWVRALLIFAIAAVIRIPFQASYLVNWDSVNFALGVESFDLESHQPHPPGYLGYVLLGRLIDWFVGDPVAALTGISVIAGAAATMWVYVLGTRIVNERAAIIAAGLFGTSPLVWYYSEVPLTYIVEVALALPLVLLVLEARKQHRASLLMLAAVLLALMGAVRQTSLVLFLPLLIHGAMAFPRKTRVVGAGVLGGLVSLWLVPLLVLSGGPALYVQLSRQLAELTGGATWLGAGSGVLQNFVVVTMALVLGMHVALLAIPVERLTKEKSPPFAPEHRRLLIVWGLPALFTYLFIHSGQLGYVLMLLPIGIIWAAKAFSAHITVPSMRTALAGLLIAVNAGGFFILPEIAYATVSQGQVSFPERMATNTLVQRGIQQVSLPRNDAHWEAMLDWVTSWDEDDIAVLAEPRDGGSFRHLSFYLPEVRIYGLGTDRLETFGHLFTSVGNSSDYSVERLQDAKDQLEIPDSVETLLIPDPRLQERLDGVLDLEYDELDTGTIVATAEVPDRDRILFLGSSGHPVLDLAGEIHNHGRDTMVVAAEGSCEPDPDDPIPLDRSMRHTVLSAC